MSSWATPGAKCVCVDASKTNQFGSELVEGMVYTVASVEVFPGDQWLPKFTGVHLVEVYREPEPEFESRKRAVPFYIHRFRPLVTKTQEQDVSMFKSLLNKAPINETA